MKAGAGKLSGVSAILLVVQLALVSSIAATYLYGALVLPPRVDPHRSYRSGIADAWPLSEPATHRRWLSEHVALCQTGRVQP
jgi:hypothetical protein